MMKGDESFLYSLPASEKMDMYPVGPAHTVFDWAALRDEFRTKLELLELKSIAVMYGLSRTEGYRDDDFARKVDDYLSKLPDPIRSRFDLAYLLGSDFWNTYDVWSMDSVQPGEPGYIGDLLDDLHDTVLAWLLEGLTAYSDIPEVMDSAYYLVSRVGNYDTFLEEEDIPLLEAAARKEISLENSEGGRKIIQLFSEIFDQARSKDKNEDDSLGDSAPPV